LIEFHRSFPVFRETRVSRGKKYSLLTAFRHKLQEAISNPVSSHLLRKGGGLIGDKLSPFPDGRGTGIKGKKQKHFFTLLPMMSSLTIIVDSQVQKVVKK